MMGRSEINLADKLIQAVLSPKLLRALIRQRVLATAEHRDVLNPGLRTVVDIGANRGQFALACRHWAPNARVISFEPLPGPAAMFRRLFAGDPTIVLHEAAIGPRPASAVMHVSRRDDSSSLLPISRLQSETFPGTEEVATATVTVGTLATFLKPDEIVAPAMLKLDVQGFELDALVGCAALLDRFNSVYCECSFVELYSGQKLAADVIAWLSGKGFRLSGVFNPTYGQRGQTVQADFLFTRAPVAS